jgi:hypothetical protein
MHNINVSYVYELDMIQSRSMATRLLGLRVRGTTGAWMSAPRVAFCEVKDPA